MAVEKQESKGGNAFAILLAGAGGGLIAGLLASRPAEAAADTTKLDYITKLLEAMGVTEEAILKAIQDFSLPGGLFPDSILTPWVATDPVKAFEQPIRNAGVFYLDNMVDARRGKRLVLRAESSLDKAVSLQMIGNFSDDAVRSTDIGIAQICPPNGYSSLGIGLGGTWQPYLGLAITVAVAPTSGILTIYYVLQE
jgi:hypothetical protein